MITIYADGGCPSNGLMRAGQAYASYRIFWNGQHQSHADRFPAGDTNNQAELRAVLAALKACDALGLTDDEIEVYTDSEFVVGAITRNWKIKEPTLLDLKNKIKQVIQERFPGKHITFHWIPRENIVRILGH